MSGHRKFRLYHKKNSERKKYADRSLTVSTPINDVISVFKVSLPLDLLSFHVTLSVSAVAEAPATSLQCLQARISSLEALPTGVRDSCVQVCVSVCVKMLMTVYVCVQDG